EVASLVSLSREMKIDAKGAREPLTVWETTGIGGTHGLFLHPPPSRMTTLAVPIPVQYSILEGKHVGRDVLDGSIVRLSETGAEIRSSASVPPPLSNLKMWIIGIETRGRPCELYAKLVEASETGESTFIVRFTALAPEVTQYLRERLG